MRETLPRGRGETHRHGDGRPEERGRRLDRRDVHEHTGPEPPTAERRAVLPERDLVAGAADDVAEGPRRHDFGGQPLEVVQGGGRHGTTARFNGTKNTPAAATCPPLP